MATTILHKEKIKVTRQRALDNGEVYFTPSRPCRNGHSSKRYTSNGRCVACQRAHYNENADAKIEYSKCWKEQNPDKVREWWNNYYFSHGEERRKRQKEYYKANKESCRAYGRAYHIRNAAQICRKSNQWKKNNKQRHLKSVCAWQDANPERVRNYRRNLDAKRRKAVGRHTSQDIKILFARQKGLCLNCGCSIKKVFHVDHIVPLARGGTNWPRNLQLLCPSCNIRKAAKDPIKWAQENGRLL